MSNTPSNDDNRAIHIKISVMLISVAVIITVIGLTVGSLFLERSVRNSIEDSLLVTVDITARYVTSEIELLKLRAAKAARDIRLLIDYAGSIENLIHPDTDDCILEHICAEHPMYMGLAVFDGTSLLFHSGGLKVDPNLLERPFMQIAMAGGQAISTTKYTPDGLLVMYVSAPICGEFVLAAVLPGLHLSDLMYPFRFWQTGRMFIGDAEGTTVSSIRREWVQDRVNLLELPLGYEGISAAAERAVAGERGVVYFSLADTLYICTFRPLPSPSTEGWFLGIIAPVHETALNDIPDIILLMGVISMILSIAAGIGAAILLKRPYNELDHLRREAEIASLSKSTFLANMSHEIRTPMNSIMGFSELAMDGEASPKTKDYLGKIYTNAEWLLHIINDILDISKIESGKMELEHIPFDMLKLMASCQTLITPKATEKGIALHFYAEPLTGKMAVGDPTKLRQVLVNLLSNAVKFTNSGQVKLTSTIRSTGEKTIAAYFEVNDSGIGMTSEHIEKIFDPFMQAESSTTRKYGGTGLGLAITKSIVERMGGTLSVKSTPDAGSTFSFELLFDTIDASANEISDSEAKAALDKILSSKTEKPAFEGEILLCEDNIMNQQVICEHLTRAGLKPVVAENGKIGVEMVQSRKEKNEKQFDLIFMDIHMPVMDGLEAAAKIFELNVGIPIVALTANIMTNDMEIYRLNGINDHMAKPFTSEDLWRCLLKYLTPVKQSGSKQPEEDDSELAAKLGITDMAFFRSLQALFVESNKDRYHEIAKALEEGDIKQAYRLAHTMKSNAAYLGKTRLQQAAEAVEHNLKEGENLATLEQLDMLKVELAAVLAEFEITLAACSDEQSEITVRGETAGKS